MAKGNAVWGVEIGAFAVKALRLEREGDSVRVVDFAVIPHRKVLTTPDLDADEMIRVTLGQLISEKDLRNQTVVLSVPGHAAFARFAKLPPVEPKKIPDIVRFEAVQQIPFPIDDVEWDYQTFASPDLPEVEVGIFAITKERISRLLSLYGELAIEPKVVTLSPVAVFNAVQHDLGLAERGSPLVILDIGTTASDLIVAEGGKCWVRTFPIGGTHFTEAIAEAFSLTYGKAEKLKLEASSSKYARQIMQAMRPVFGDLLGDVQKSLSYYQSLNRGVELTEILGIGSTFRIPGLRKFLGQQLQCEVARLDEFRRVQVAGAAGADFAAATVNMTTAYGLALQGLGLAPIDVNLAPVPVLRQQVWAAKGRWFAAAAGVVVAAGGLMFLRGALDGRSVSSGWADTDQLVQNTISRARQEKSRYDQLRDQSRYGFTAENMRRLTDYREVWPQLVRDVNTCLASANPQEGLLGGDPARIAAIPPGDRNLIMLEDLSGKYENRGGKRIISVSMSVRFSHRDRQEFLNETVAQWLRNEAATDRPEVPYRIVANSIRLNVDRLRTVKVGSPTDQLAGAGSDLGGSGLGGGSGQVDLGGEVIGGTGSAGSAGGLRGRRGVGTAVDAPGSFGMAASGMDGSAGPETTRQEEREQRGGQRPGAASTADAPPVAIDSVAPIPSAPPLFAVGQEYHEAVVTFEVELKGPAAASGGSNEDSYQ